VSDLSQHFAAILTRERVLADLSHEELSFLCSMHRTAISELERGVRLPRLDTIVKLAGGLEIEPCELLGGIRWRPGRLAAGSFEVTDEPSGEALEDA
jgi:transcriptional regulator with XRE-family HTH domain